MTQRRGFLVGNLFISYLFQIGSKTLSSLIFLRTPFYGFDKYKIFMFYLIISSFVRQSFIKKKKKKNAFHLYKRFNEVKRSKVEIEAIMRTLHV